MKHHPHRRKFWISFLLLATVTLIAILFIPFFYERWTKPGFYETQVLRRLPKRGLLKKKVIRVAEQFAFENAGSLKLWEEKVFKNKTEFSVLSEPEGSFLRVRSHDACSGLYRKVEYDVTSDLMISWRWRAHTFPTKKTPNDFKNKKEDDFSARVYAIFPASNFFKSDVIEYVWDASAPAGVVEESPYSDRVKLLILRNGPAPSADGGWVHEERNVYDDFIKIFGRMPKKRLGVVAVMSDSDNTESSSEADFGSIEIGFKRNTNGKT